MAGQQGVFLSDEQWKFYEENGYLKLGKLLSTEELRKLQQRIDEIMLGTAKDIDYNRLLMQLDSTSGKYEDAGEQSKGHKGATLDYRKIQDLEFDKIFLEFIQRPIFHEIVERQYGKLPSYSCFRAMFMNKPAHKGTFLPWHQDRWNYLNIDPLVTIWAALDPATVTNGCVQVIPKTHKFLINKEHTSGFLNDNHVSEHVSKEKVVYLELEAGEVVLLHNWLLHSSDINNTDSSRRAFSVCYMDGKTKSNQPEAEPFSIVFGEGAL